MMVKSMPCYCIVLDQRSKTLLIPWHTVVLNMMRCLLKWMNMSHSMGKITIETNRAIKKWICWKLCNDHDNGPQFTPKLFTKYMYGNGIEHIKGIPYWLQLNGEVENHNKTLLKMIRVSKIESIKRPQHARKSAAWLDSYQLYSVK